MNRYFYAINLDDKTKQQIHQYMESIKPLLDTSQVRWSPIENYHITLKFWGKLKDEKLATIRQEAEAALKAHAPFTLDVTECFAFDTKWQGHIIALRVDLSEPLLALATDLQRDPPFMPHITLGRAKQPIDSTFFFPPFSLSLPVTDVTLFDSVTKETGALYEIVEVVNLES